MTVETILEYLILFGLLMMAPYTIGGLFAMIYLETKWVIGNENNVR